MLTDEWQPIETAPRDETAVLLYFPGSWETDGVRVGWWHEGAWYEHEWSSNPMTDFYEEPTHWMPLPHPPQEQTNAD
jgi:hypothetical protein